MSKLIRVRLIIYYGLLIESAFLYLDFVNKLY